MFRITRIVAFGFGLLGGVLTSQLPEFSQQYRQRLGGSIDELTRVLQRFDSDARNNSETRESAILRLRGNADNLISRQGVAMQANAERLSRLEAHRRAMMEAGPFMRVALMIRNGDTDVMEAAYQDFEPAVPVTEEGILAAALGFIAAWGCLLVLANFVRSLRRPRTRVARA
ncbi:DUF2937 family protein [Microvirga rosea]|uniref:DUF2937 family protein n=1 Tax=Microvirga rosea TaxID=2715425 RepID=UPI001D0B9F8D|nr:DUF2937 family protein [Microvirga rosea]MCB8822448.1 DUF2937 family protein [Microvirga rosea]